MSSAAVVTGALRVNCSAFFMNLASVSATTAERFFRIDRSQENLHYITDISSEDLYILDPDFISSNPHSGFDVNGNRNSSVLKENNFVKDSDLIFTFSMPVTPPKSPG